MMHCRCSAGLETTDLGLKKITTGRTGLSCFAAGDAVLGGDDAQVFCLAFSSVIEG